MSRWPMLFLLAIATTGTAFASDKAVPPHARYYHGAGRLPAGLPRPHYDYRTTIADLPTYPPRRPYVVVAPLPDDGPDLLFTPDGRYAPLLSAPLLPGSAALPGYYGMGNSYYYQGPYYGGPYVSYWNRLPYACGVYGYC